MAAAETSERNLFDGRPSQALRESAVMHDVAVADVDAVMQISAARRNHM
jgi:hypothetical protein